MIYTQIDYIGGNSGMIGIFPPMIFGDSYPTFVVAAVIVMLVVLYRLEHSDFGKVLIAIRNNDAIVQSVGINVHLTKVLCVTIASLVAGLAGGLLLDHAGRERVLLATVRIGLFDGHVAGGVSGTGLFGRGVGGLVPEDRCRRGV